MENIIKKLLEDKKRLITTRESVDTVINSVGAIIDRYYSNNHSYKTKAKLISERILVFRYYLLETTPLGDSIKSLKQETENLIDNIISEVKLLGLPKPQDLKIDKSISVTSNFSQQQEQSQNTNFSFIFEALKKELTGRQFDEIKDIVNNEPDAKKARPKIIEKLNSFGENLLSSMLANLLTNPSIWSFFFNKMVGG